MVIHHVTNGRLLARITWTPLPQRQVQAYGDGRASGNRAANDANLESSQDVVRGG